MSDNNQDGMRSYENDQPDVFQPEDISDELIDYDGFMEPGYTPKTEERTEQQQGAAANTDPEIINYDDESDDPSKKLDPNSPEAIAAAEAGKIDYEDPNAPVKKEEEFKAEEAIKKLEALGFKVDQNAAPDPLQAKEFEIKELDRINNDLKSYLKLDDMRLCREHVIDEVIKKWQSAGKDPDINSDEFKTEVEYEMVQFEDNPRLASLQANQVKQILNNAIQKNEDKKTEISTEVKNTRDKAIQENRQALQGTFNGYNGKTLFGVKITPDHLKTAYKSITSGDFTKQIESDKSLQAEFALFLGLRDQISNNGGGTYNEGVAAAVKALEGNGPKVESSLAHTASRSGAGSVVDRASAWRAAEKVETTKK